MEIGAVLAETAHGLGTGVAGGSECHIVTLAVIPTMRVPGCFVDKIDRFGIFAAEVLERAQDANTLALQPPPLLRQRPSILPARGAPSPLRLGLRHQACPDILGGRMEGPDQTFTLTRD